MKAELKKFDAIYARQSVEKGKCISIQEQFDVTKPLCTYYSDLGKSGDTMERSGLKSLFDDVEK